MRHLQKTTESARRGAPGRHFTLCTAVSETHHKRTEAGGGKTAIDYAEGPGKPLYLIDFKGKKKMWREASIADQMIGMKSDQLTKSVEQSAANDWGNWPFL
ncbi:hypothetical protein I9018_16040 [Pseudomonas sp. MPFS]|uniref:hypothetical protein n=1 Tax=Pseudomonas sp. MPFS TaxID=2795724 RepID=UPI001F129284|nr:hypothetical protein [Pseudomonas sp. MPFS]UMZ15110.1 hypothetical protein I9018_16040 [Pseudomonas sp. MPFS]